MKPVALASEAAIELAHASDWYEAQRSGLGGESLEEVETFLPHVGERPGAFPLVHAMRGLDIRRALLPRFPYALVFFERAAEVRVIAIAHSRREPGYWMDRLR